MEKVKMLSLWVFTAFTAIAAVAGPAAGAAQQTRPVMSKVTAATVFLQGAEVTSVASLALPGGASEVSIEGISPDVDRNSIRVNIGGGVVVSAHEFSIDYLSSAHGTAGSPRLRMLRDSIAFYREQIARIDADIKINTAMQGYLETGIAKNVSGSEAGLSIDRLRGAMDYYKSKSEEIHAAGRKLTLGRLSADTALARLNNQLDEESGNEAKTSGVLRLNLSAPSAGTFPVTIVYYTPAASWTPFYDINVVATDLPVVIAARSRVSQHTGVDWENVRLTLSTSVPSNGRVAPLFSTWFLRPRPVPMPMVRAMAMQNAYSYDTAEAEAFVVEEAMEMAKAEPATIYDHVTTSTSALSVTYNIDLPYTIPTGGKEQTIDLATKQAPADYKYYCAPRLDEATYLIAEIANWEALELLSAPANITYDGTWIGETWIDASSTRELLTLTLGTDKRVSVTRELAREFSSTRTVGGTTERTFAWRITVRNNQTRPVAIVLKEQYPTSTDRDVTVTLDPRGTTPWTANVPETGVVTWEGAMAPGEVRFHTFSYTVKYPRGMNLDL